MSQQPKTDTDVEHPGTSRDSFITKECYLGIPASRILRKECTLKETTE